MHEDHEQGSVTIPIAYRQALGLLPDCEVEFELADGAVLVRPSIAARREHAREVVARMRGSATTKATTDQIIALLRGES